MAEERSSRKEERLWAPGAGDFSARSGSGHLLHTVAVLLAVTAAVSIASARPHALERDRSLDDGSRDTADA